MQGSPFSPGSLLDDRVRQGRLHHLQLRAGVAGASLLQVPAPGRPDAGKNKRYGGKKKAWMKGMDERKRIYQVHVTHTHTEGEQKHEK